MSTPKLTPTDTIVILIAIALAILLSGCASHKQAASDTILMRHDTITIQPRIIPVEQTLPESIVTTEIDTAEREASAEDSLYKATAIITGNKLRLTLQTKPAAKVKGSITVSDTTRARTTTAIIATGREVESKPPDTTTTTTQSLLAKLGWLFIIEIIVIILWYAAKHKRE